MSEETKQCPFCGEEIMSAAIKCRHCGEWLNKPKTSEPSNNVPIQPNMIECPICGEEILATAKKCKHCGEMVNSASTIRNDFYKGNNQDLPYVKKISTTKFILLTIVTLGIYQIVWLYKTCNALNLIENNSKKKIGMWLPTTYVIVYVVSWIIETIIAINVNEHIANAIYKLSNLCLWGFLIVITDKGIKIIEKYAHETYNCKITHNSWRWLLTVYYLNFAINTFEERVNKTKNYIN